MLHTHIHIFTLKRSLTQNRRPMIFLWESSFSIFVGHLYKGATWRGSARWRGSVFCATLSRVFTLVRVQFLETPFRGTGLLIINTDRSTLPIPVGPAEESLHEWSLWGSHVEAQWARRQRKQQHRISTNLSTAEPVTGSARVLCVYPMLV